jgi:hypothetical protein
MATNAVRQCTICRTEVVINSKRNYFCGTWYEISFSQNYYLKPNPVPLQFNDHISNQKALGLFPSTQTQNNLEWIMFWRNRLSPSSEHLLRMQTVIYSETLLPRSEVILNYTTLCLFTTVKNWSKDTLCSEPTLQDICCCTLHPFWVTVSNAWSNETRK